MRKRPTFSLGAARDRYDRLWTPGADLCVPRTSSGVTKVKRIVRLTNRSEHLFGNSNVMDGRDLAGLQFWAANPRRRQWHATRAGLGSAVLQFPYWLAAECGVVHCDA